MSQQGGRPTGHEDDWWRQLYDDSTDDTGPAPAPDSLDDRFASASGAVGDGPRGRSGPAEGRTARPYGAEPVVPAPRTGADDFPDALPPADRTPPRAPWEPPPPRPPGPASFPAASPPSAGRDDAARPGADPGGLPPEGPGGAASPGGSGGAPAGPGRPPSSAPPVPPPRTAPPTWPDLGSRSATVDDAPVIPTSPAGPQASPASPGELPPLPPRPAGPPPTAPPPTAPPPTAPPPMDPPSAPPRPAEPPAPPEEAGPRIERPVSVPHSRGHVGTRPPTYDAEPTALPAADPDDLDDLVADTVLDGARYGACTLRAVSVRGDSARYRGEPRRDSLLTARFGTGERALLLVAMATGARAAPGAHRAAAEACHWIGRAVGRSHARLVEDIRDGRRGDLKSGLHRLTDRSLGKLRASASERGLDPEEYAASLRCLLLPADPACRTRVFFGVGPGGLFRLREGEWQDIEPPVADVRGEPVVGFGSPPSETPEGDRLTMDLGIPTPPSPYEPAPEPPREPFRFRTSVARPGDTLLMCSGGLAEPLRGEPELGEYLAERWSRPEPPGLAAFLADSQVRVKGYADDRTAAAVWEA
ncbi:protein phosphatase 2C domain-containing protein [Streptomyces sp. NPDC050674]|uniref:protein phosphatase 2C domain-containing protein n=1 Tax=Streptomyces sp. NPDC050674 TaxID=3157216 RepID=UPI0034292BBE